MFEPSSNILHEVMKARIHEKSIFGVESHANGMLKIGKTVSFAHDMDISKAYTRKNRYWVDFAILKALRNFVWSHAEMLRKESTGAITCALT